MMDQALDMAKIAYEALDEKKGEAIKVIDISQDRKSTRLNSSHRT